MGHRDINHSFVAVIDNEITNENLSQGKEIGSNK